MSVSLEDNFQFSYQRLLLFLSRPDEKGYIFCRADDYRFIPKITANLLSDLELKGIHAVQVYLQKDTDEPLLYQIEKASKNAGALIVANLYDIVNHSESGLAYLTQLNFAREALWEINKPILFWADAQSMNIIANHAPDLYSQRRHTTIHFTGIADGHIKEKLRKDGWETFLSSPKFKDIETNINILEKRLQGAEETAYPVSRIITEIALPLAKNYAQFGLAQEARTLVGKYDYALQTANDENVLQQLADIYYSLHEYENAIKSLRSANDLITKKYTLENNKLEYPEKWFDNLINIAEWSAETNKYKEVLPELIDAATILEKGKDGTWEKRTLTVIQKILGDTMCQLDNLPEAQKYYEQALNIGEQLSSNNPNSEQLQRDLCVSFARLGDTSEKMGNLLEAKKYYEQGLKIAEQLSRSNQDSEKPQRDLSVFFEKLGDILDTMGDLSESKKYYEQSLKIREQLSSNNPNSEQLQRDLGISYLKIARLLLEESKESNALKYYQDSLSILEKLSIVNPLSQQLKNDIAWLNAKIKEVSDLINSGATQKET